MKRLFYKIEMRMGSIYTDEESGELTEERFYYSNGYCVIEDGEIKGFLTDDLFKATITQTTFSIDMLCCDYESDENGKLSEEYFGYNFKVKLNEKVKFPSRFIFMCKYSETDENILIALDFLSEVTDISKQNEIYYDLVEVGLI